MPTYINDIATVTPEHRYDVSEITAFLTHSAQNNDTARKIKVIAQKSGIAQRFSVLDDFRFPNNPELFNGHVPLIEERMLAYQKHGLPLALKALEKLDFQTDAITHIITVSCTGMASPGLELQLVKAAGLPNNCVKLAVNFIGCHGVFHALKMAQSFVDQNAQANVLIVSVELCSLHYQPSTDDDSILANILFGDGTAACLITGSPSQSPQLKINGFSQFLIPDDQQLMAWNVHSKGFLLKLSSYVPQAIGEGLQMLSEHNKDPNTLWAAHPGGKSILDAIEEKLNLEPERLKASRDVLSRVGNLSSATILFVLEAILEQAVSNRPLNALGFGPGLTIELMKAELMVE